MKPGTWTTGDKRVLPIAEMGTLHLVHCIAMLERWISATDQLFETPCVFDSDSMASYYADQETDRAMLRVAAYMAKKRELEEELKRRP